MKLKELLESKIDDSYFTTITRDQILYEAEQLNILNENWTIEYISEAKDHLMLLSCKDSTIDIFENYVDLEDSRGNFSYID